MLSEQVTISPREKLSRELFRKISAHKLSSNSNRVLNYLLANYPWDEYFKPIQYELAFRLKIDKYRINKIFRSLVLKEILMKKGRGEFKFHPDFFEH